MILKTKLTDPLQELQLDGFKKLNELLKINNEMKHYELELQKKIVEQQEKVQKSLLESMKKLEAAEKTKPPLFSLKKFSDKKLA